MYGGGSRSWVAWAAAAAFAGGATTVFAFCSVYTSDQLAPPSSGTGWWSGIDDAGCFSAQMPTTAERPKPGDTAEVPAIYFAIGDMRFGSQNASFQPDPNAWEDLGFDLDGVCTNSPTCPTDTPLVSCKPTLSEVAYDGNYCRDNTFGRLEVQAASIPEVGGKYGLNDDAFNCALCSGAYNFIIKLSKYNGAADDDSVRIDIYPSPGLENVLPWNCQDPGWRSHPCFTADMPWLIRDTAVTLPQGGPNLPDAVLSDPNAYVRNGYLVATLPSGTFLWFPSIPGRKTDVATAYPLKLTQGIVAGHVTKGQDGTWTIDDGTIAGRSRESDIIDGFNLIGFCASTDPTNYALMQNFLHGKLDILANGSVDPNVTCDAVSVGLAFTARQATPGTLIHVDDLVPCATAGDGGTDGGDAGDAGGLDAPAD